ncbi:MAG: ABC transporter permease subunit [Bacteroidetes bacterium]|nr:ABC transporter permease subunit [Bacteroidota bacterium]
MNLRAVAKVIKYEWRDIFRSRWTLLYALFFLVTTEALFRFTGSGAKALLGLSSIVLVIIPLVSIVFGTIYLYNARPFTELLLAQPVNRAILFYGLFAGLTLPLSGSFLIGAGIPIVLRGGLVDTHMTAALLMTGSGVLLTFIFVALAFFIALRFEDRLRGLSVSVLLWIFFSVVYDGLVLVIVSVFANYPLEKPMLALMILNPIDLARVLLLLNLEASALMGYTGAVFEQFFGSLGGVITAIAGLVVWVTVPLIASVWKFKRKDF